MPSCQAYADKEHCGFPPLPLRSSSRHLNVDLIYKMKEGGGGGGEEEGRKKTIFIWTITFFFLLLLLLHYCYMYNFYLLCLWLHIRELQACSAVESKI